MRPVLALILFLNLSCSSQPRTSEANSVETSAVSQKEYFRGKRGCFLLYNLKTKAVEKVMGEEHCREQLPACSTFKVPLAVIAFESGILKDENEILKWDGKREEREAVNRDHDAKSWMSDSVVWFSQRITRKLGKERFQKFLNDFQYGNRDLAAGIEQAWLISPGKRGPALRISAYEQLEFMEKLWTDNLPVTKRSMDLTRRITSLEVSPQGFRLSGKTGSNFYDAERKQRLGWFIAHLEKGETSYLAVTNFSDLEPSEEQGFGGLKAKAMTKEILTDLGLW